jgi:hypothetical protein
MAGDESPSVYGRAPISSTTSFAQVKEGVAVLNLAALIPFGLEDVACALLPSEASDTVNIKSGGQRVPYPVAELELRFRPGAGLDDLVRQGTLNPYYRETILRDGNWSLSEPVHVAVYGSHKNWSCRGLLVAEDPDAPEESTSVKLPQPIIGIIADTPSMSRTE